MKIIKIIKCHRDKETLKNWRQDRKSYDKSMLKASQRSQADIPFGIADSSTAKDQLKKVNRTYDVNTKMAEIVLSLKKSRAARNTGTLNSSVELNHLHEEIQKLTNLQKEIINLKTINETAMIKYEDLESSKHNQYKAQPSIII